MSSRNGLAQRVLQALADCGPMTGAELVAYLGETKQCIAAATTQLCRDHVQTPKRIHVTDYVYDHEGQRCYPRPVFALGRYPDAIRPKRDLKANQRKYRSKMKVLLTNTFVFNLARPLRGSPDGRTRTQPL